jgi:hypothetical protein
VGGVGSDATHALEAVFAQLQGGAALDVLAIPGGVHDDTSARGRQRQSTIAKLDAMIGQVDGALENLVHLRRHAEASPASY